MSGADRLGWSIRCVCWVGACLLVSACAALPEVRYLSSSLAAPANPTVTNAQGRLSAKQSHSLLVRRWRNSHADVAALAALEEAATGSPLIAGNKVTLLYDGPQTMAAMMAAISTARDHINLETYIFDQDEVGMRFAELLMARQRAGVQVNVIYDSVGTLGTPQAFFDKMRAAGIHLLAFNPVNPLKLIGPWEPNNRDHRKILVVYGLVAFTGGVNISSTYANSSLFRSKARRDAKVGWRDTHIKIEGPAVAALQWVFLDNWLTQESPELADSNYFPPLKNAGDKLVRVLASTPGGDHEIYKAYALAIQEAKQTIHITSAYFVPDAQILEALSDAARRGVDVKIILPGVTDSGLVFHAAQSFYGEMLAGGIKIYQLQIAVLHAKTAVIDKVWSTVGSTNIDTRSFLHNDEINVVVLGDEFGNALESAFAEDLGYSVEITSEQWAQRPWSDRLKEWAARRLEYWL
ncbi:MAG: cardiolipin synthase [Betaproteobacteria bacterium]|nr:cardiolipin synthase [Betaproteobacteria bacterium]